MLSLGLSPIILNHHIFARYENMMDTWNMPTRWPVLVIDQFVVLSTTSFIYVLFLILNQLYFNVESLPNTNAFSLSHCSPWWYIMSNRLTYKMYSTGLEHVTKVYPAGNVLFQFSMLKNTFWWTQETTQVSLPCTIHSAGSYTSLLLSSTNPLSPFSTDAIASNNMCSGISDPLTCKV